MTPKNNYKGVYFIHFSRFLKSRHLFANAKNVFSPNSLSTLLEDQCRTEEISLSNEEDTPNKDQYQQTPTPQHVKIILLPAALSKVSSKITEVTSIVKKKLRYPQATEATSCNASWRTKLI